MRDFWPAPIASSLRRFRDEEEGGITALSLQMLLTTLVIGGLAVDFGVGMASKNQLQVAADSAAHAAIYSRELNTESEAKTIAVDVAAKNMPSGKFGSVLKPEDITFGHWNRDTQIFTVDPGSRDAVLVATKRHAGNGNGVTTYMLGLIGVEKFDVTAGSVFETYYPTCFREGFVAQNRVDMQSNSYYTSGFCIHSQTHVSVSSGNTFEPGVVVSMPDKRNIELPNSGFESNSGLQVALRDGSYKLRILSRINTIIFSVENPRDDAVGIMKESSGTYHRDYIKIANPVQLNYKWDVDESTMTRGRIHVATCRQDKMHMTFKSTAVMREAVLITNCRLAFQAGAQIEDSVIISTSNEDNAIYGSAGVVIGKDDNCAEGGDVQVVTLGGVDFAAGVNIFGSQIIAAKDVSITANADGIEGVAVVAGGMLDVTSSGAFGFCDGDGMNNNYEAAYFRLAK